MPLLYLPDELPSSTVKNVESETNVSALLQTFHRVYSKLSSYRYNVKKHDGYYGPELWEASGRGNEQMVKLLLDNGTDVNTQGGLYGTALRAASNGGHEQIVKLLLFLLLLLFNAGGNRYS
jgi:ankyrin repeat protein